MGVVMVMVVVIILLVVISLISQGGNSHEGHDGHDRHLAIQSRHFCIFLSLQKSLETASSTWGSCSHLDRGQE